MSTPRAENPLLAPYGTPNPSRNDISIQDIAQESLAPGNVLDDGNNNITTGSLQTRTLQAAIGRLPVAGQEGDEAAWGSNFWVTLVDPQTQTSFFACPATGQVSWDPPVGNFVLPPSTEGEWWELSDDSRGGLPYYYHTKTGETVWERPMGFVIPLGIIQNTALGRRLSTRLSKSFALDPKFTNQNDPSEKLTFQTSRSHVGEHGIVYSPDQMRQTRSSRSASGRGAKKQLVVQRSYSSERRSDISHNWPHVLGQQLTPIPGSDVSGSPSPSIREYVTPTPVFANGVPRSSLKGKNMPNGAPKGDFSHTVDSVSRPQTKSSPYVAHRPRPPQSLTAALEMLATSNSDIGHDSIQRSPTSPTSDLSAASGSSSTHAGLTVITQPTALTNGKGKGNAPTSPQRRIPAVPDGRNPGVGRGTPGPMVAGKGISRPIPNHAATLEMSPVKNRATGNPILVELSVRPMTERIQTATLHSGTYPILPYDLASDIQQFSQSEFAQQYFSTHRTGFIFRRRVPVTQMMTWQKTPLTSPLLTLNRTLNRDAVKVFKVTQHIMGDRERERSAGLRRPPESHGTIVSSHNTSTTSLGGNLAGMLEEERWLLGEGLTHGELRDEIYCQVMKQLTGNPATESIFKGWQLLCVLLITFPPSKNFETYLRSFIQKHIQKQEGRVDVMAKYCLRRLAYIAKKGPRGKPPTIAEIETASDAAFHPSTFGESLDAIIRLQERNYPQQKVPIILPFLANGILALGGTKSEGIFRVPGDGDSVSELKLRIDRGYYTLDGITDPHVLASLMKLWLRELCDPLVPEEMYNECITSSKDVEACIRIVERLPTINRRVVLFVVSFLQLFLDDRIQNATKMTPANLALVMAPNLLRCNSDSMSVVFTNAQYEQIFVYNLLLHLNCGEADDNYAPIHGLGAVPSIPVSRTSKSRSRHP